MKRVLSLCSGIGGFDLGCELVNRALGYEHYQIVGQVEIDEFCLAVLAKNWPDVKRLADIYAVKGDEFGPIDLIIAGFPCQPYSVAGKGAGQMDSRDLWPEVLRIVKSAKPGAVCFENVAGFAGHDDGLPRIWDGLEGEGYECGAVEIPACAVGASHGRMRTFVVGYAGSAERRTLAEGRSHVADGTDPGREEAAGGFEFSGEESGTLANGDRGRQSTGGMSSAREYDSAGRRIAVADAAELTERSAPDEVDALPNGGHSRPQFGGGRSLTLADRSLIGCGPRPGVEPQRRQGRRLAGNGDRKAATGHWRPQPRLGDCTSRISRRLAGFDDLFARIVAGQRHPALMGEEQHDWEPPRLAPKGKQWKQKIAALGNSILPVQIAPVLLAMALLDQHSPPPGFGP